MISPFDVMQWIHTSVCMHPFVGQVHAGAIFVTFRSSIESPTQVLSDGVSCSVGLQRCS